MKQFLAAVFALILPCCLLARDMSHPLTLSELVDIALENNPSTRQAWWNAHRAAAALGNAKSSYYPQVGIDAFANHGRTFKFINGPDTNYTMVGADLFLSLLLYDCGARSANVESAKNALVAANWQSDWSLQKVMIRVLENAYTLMHAQMSLEAAIISEEDAKKVLHTARELNRTGLSPISDVYTTQATLSQMKIETSMQRAHVDIQKGKLVSSLGLPANTCLELAPIESMPQPEMQQTDCLIDIAYQQRADLSAMQARVAASAANMDRVRSSYGPKFSIKGVGGANHFVNDKSNGLQYEVAFNVDMPLFTGFEATYQSRMAYADTQMSIEEMNELQLSIAMEVLTHSRTLQAAQEILPDAEDQLINATKAYDSVLERYRAGKEHIAEVSNALRQLANARLRYSDVKTRWLIALANLAYATGTLAPYMETPCEIK